MKKKLLSILTTVFVLMCLIPTSAFAKQKTYTGYVTQNATAYKKNGKRWERKGTVKKGTKLKIINNIYDSDICEFKKNNATWCVYDKYAVITSTQHKKYKVKKACKYYTEKIRIENKRWYTPKAAGTLKKNQAVTLYNHDACPEISFKTKNKKGKTVTVYGFIDSTKVLK